MKNSTISFIDGDLDQRSIYIITQVEKNNELMVVSPNINPDKFDELLRQKKITIKMDIKPKLDLLKKVRVLVFEQTKSMLSRRLEISWYRILVSFLIGFAVFLFMNFIIIDPIPILDELGVSLLIGVISYIFLYKFNLLYFIPKKKMEEYSIYIDSIAVYDSKNLSYLNILFEKYYNKLGNIVKKNYKTIFRREITADFRELINKDLNEIEIKDIIEIKDMLNMISNNYKFNKINKYQKYKTEEKKSILSKERFLYFYILSDLLL